MYGVRPPELAPTSPMLSALGIWMWLWHFLTTRSSSTVFETFTFTYDLTTFVFFGIWFAMDNISKHAACNAQAWCEFDSASV